MDDLLDLAPNRMLKRIEELETEVTKLQIVVIHLGNRLDFLEENLPVLKDYRIESGKPGEIIFKKKEVENK